MSKAVETEKIGDKEVPVLVWPDGRRIHLMPHKIEDGQDPAQQLASWLEAWVNDKTRRFEQAVTLLKRIDDAFGLPGYAQKEDTEHKVMDDINDWLGDYALDLENES